ncbi:D-beta-D-heptose 7-phosphate kinase/D-beta-D-heptose 1-phosphate adenosyltransferase [Arthrobacter sp. V4I6]|uniref:PfkB family carbohydrate kinase n=1 Tax=unclassified Arthrobacter TaxID=235627 RepID=UPI0027815B7F|nr:MULTISPECIES: PfkB family carbohydrate kinase [unclassified Arthrobacter]MDQ0821226.1 D-beta-D-heptose 7-phosphate kinase/D-beta-D-heptose 1-phosphate adenosyltransferase [Arthrobacter sp. V1I7]MDQ0855489.1 D-beta-D-heptose 7-phosphate kinase/D-beta-D-heptose 1-phosphate adenosyltransferase [Arthrobacter sp. V4I6]
MSIVVVGDVLLDVDLDGQATRLSPDAPVPVVDVSNVRRRAGGAGLVARMLAADGHSVVLVTVLGADEASSRVEEELSGVTVVAGPSGAPTPVKTRVRAGGHPLVRFDEGCERPAVPKVTAAMLQALDGASAVVVADYGRGLTANAALRAALSRLAGRVPIVWDPHPAGSTPVPGVDVVTPNLAEARAAEPAVGPDTLPATGPDTLPAAGPDTRRHAGPDTLPDAAGALAVSLLRRWQSKAVLVTQGERGAVLVQGSGGKPVQIAVPRTTVTDPCGAGDRLAASLAVHLAAGRDLEGSAVLAVREASAFLAGGGVAGLGGRRGSFPHAVPGADRPDPDALALARRVRRAGGTVVATGGCFDLLHAGHARSLAAARRLGDCLIVCLNSDASVRRIKGASRPIINEQDRSELLLALQSVDAVLVFDEDTPETCLGALRPDIWVKGGDHDVRDLPETPLVESWGGRCLTVPHYPARSTTHLADALARVG